MLGEMRGYIMVCTTCLNRKRSHSNPCFSPGWTRARASMRMVPCMFGSKCHSAKKPWGRWLRPTFASQKKDCGSFGNV